MTLLQVCTSVVLILPGWIHGARNLDVYPSSFNWRQSNFTHSAEINYPLIWHINSSRICALKAREKPPSDWTELGPQNGFSPPFLWANPRLQTSHSINRLGTRRVGSKKTTRAGCACWVFCGVMPQGDSVISDVRKAHVSRESLNLKTGDYLRGKVRCWRN